MKFNKKIRNIAIIAHVDHGKTTLVDSMFKQSGIFKVRDGIEERIMDSLDLERERGITIAAKNCSINYKDIKVNIIDTPGHADFGSEVERALFMVDGAILLVDASEGPLPQTRFVLKKALEKDLKIIVVINKIDRKDARIKEVSDEIFELFVSLDATDEQLDYPILYAVGRDGIAKRKIDDDSKDLTPLFESIYNYIPAPLYRDDDIFQMLVCDLSYSDYLGRLAIGKVINGNVKKNDQLVCINSERGIIPLTVTKLQVYEGNRIKEVESVESGEIIVLAGVEDVRIGDTICNKDFPKSLPGIFINEPAISMVFTVNSSPLAGREGKNIQSKKLRERLYKETLKNVGIQVEDSVEPNTFIVKGRGELQLSVLIESMRREGFELTVGRPEVIFKYKDGKRFEPIEHIFIDTEDMYVGIVTEKLSLRKGILYNLSTNANGRVRMEFLIPSRGLIGYRSEFLTDTRGTGIMNGYLECYEEYKGDIPSRTTGSLVSEKEGKAVAYALSYLEERGRLFIVPNDPVYEGMIIGEHSKENDLNVNPTKEKRLSNMRSVSKDDSILLTPVVPMTLEKAMEFIKDDEMIEVTPRSIRLRKKVLSTLERRRLRGEKKE
ncbi:MAG: GTP-binding protein lepA [candidate division TA06 bacterium 32_111]|uniref:Large ribosomal subunit assembly factor BipA n=2 Tax=Bacteria candidate phyla TaxID=1783234 RepID=A0A117M6A6_UNCT6|nr:MAG: GTP-binding protein lepA [candidate division TA06 bacterium 32_111]KUK86707.1 MAG: GTP-binding protein lepA [candidate division TA06 bacterium 34_109]HAF08443.1 translational GTPase TypA [candidate division WOR-3 bacterium]HCP17421.1 translational GTPase TypA [candidate division WOR-3 bacterium]